MLLESVCRLLLVCNPHPIIPPNSHVASRRKKISVYRQHSSKNKGRRKCVKGDILNLCSVLWNKQDHHIITDTEVPVINNGVVNIGKCWREGQSAKGALACE